MLEGSLGVNHAYARLVVEELVRNGVRQFCISPGSRSTPLVLACAEHPSCDHVVHVDERGAAFHAVGYARATGMPAALICTSGTAVANYLPAVIEASQSCVPLVVLTADRPAELFDTSANQTIRQYGIFGEYTRWHADFPPPTPETDPLLSLSSVSYAVFQATSDRPGPVHLNFQFRKPLIGGSTSPWGSVLGPWIARGTPITEYQRPHPEREELPQKLLETLRTATRGALLVGTLPSGTPAKPFRELADHLGWPLITDITSGVRFGCGAPVISHAATYVEHFAGDLLSPDVIVHLGGMPVSNSLLGYLSSSPSLIHVHSYPVRYDPHARVSMRLTMDPSRFCLAASRALPKSLSYLAQPFLRAEEIAAEVLHAHSTHLSERECVRALFAALPDRSAVYLANSLPVRLADLSVAPSSNDVLIGVHRGVSGIDGTIASAAGFARGCARPTVLITGDLSFLHDVNSLLLVRDSPVPLLIFVMNNDGGGIFSFLPGITDSPHFERFFATPHGLNFRDAASLFHLPYEAPDDLRTLHESLATFFASGESGVIEIRTSREETYAEERGLRSTIQDLIRARCSDVAI